MIAAGIRELKVHLSAYIRKVRAGETVRVTAHGKVVAVLAPPVEPTPERKLLEKMAREGLIILGNGKPVGFKRPIKLRKGAKPTSEMIIEDRRW